MPVQKEHFQMMHHRLKQDHIQGWYDGGEESFEEYTQGMIDRMNNPHQFPYLFLVDKIPIGYIQCYDCYGIAEDVYGDLVEKGTWGVDMYIGEKNYLGKGYGYSVLKEFVGFIRKTYGATQISIDPTPTNVRAIWAYKKAGFEKIKEFVIDGNTHLLMVYRRYDDVQQILSNNRSSLGNEFTVKAIKENDHGRFVYRIINELGHKYILKGLPKKKADELTQTLDVLSYIYDHGFVNYPKIILTDNNEVYNEQGETIYHVMEHIDGEHPKTSTNSYATLAKLLAQLHNISSEGCKHKSVRDVEHEKDGFQPNAERYNLGEKFIKITNNFPDFTELPKAIIHTDVHIENAIENNAGEIYLIDWDSVAVGTRVFDLGFFITMQFIDLECNFKETWAKAFFEAYEQEIEQKLSNQEKESMIDAGLFYSTVCVQFGDVEKNWKRIQWIDSNRQIIYNSIFK